MLWFHLFLTLAGNACLYLASPHQRWLRAPLPGRTLLRAGLALNTLALAGWMTSLHPATAFFLMMTLSMLLLTAFPFIGLLRDRRRDGPR